MGGAHPTTLRDSVGFAGARCGGECAHMRCHQTVPTRQISQNRFGAPDAHQQRRSSQFSQDSFGLPGVVCETQNRRSVQRRRSHPHLPGNHISRGGLGMSETSPRERRERVCRLGSLEFKRGSTMEVYVYQVRATGEPLEGKGHLWQAKSDGTPMWQCQCARRVLRGKSRRVDGPRQQDFKWTWAWKCRYVRCDPGTLSGGAECAQDDFPSGSGP